MVKNVYIQFVGIMIELVYVIFSPLETNHPDDQLYGLCNTNDQPMLFDLLRRVIFMTIKQIDLIVSWLKDILPDVHGLRNEIMSINLSADGSFRPSGQKKTPWSPGNVPFPPFGANCQQWKCELIFF